MLESLGVVVLCFMFCANRTFHVASPEVGQPTYGSASGCQQSPALAGELGSQLQLRGEVLAHAPHSLGDASNVDAVPSPMRLWGTAARLLPTPHIQVNREEPRDAQQHDVR